MSDKTDVWEIEEIRIEDVVVTKDGGLLHAVERTPVFFKKGDRVAVKFGEKKK